MARNWRRNLPPVDASRRVRGTGPESCEYLAMLIKPDEDDACYGQIGIGRNGQLLDDFLRTINFSREKIRVEAVVPYWTPGPTVSTKQLAQYTQDALDRIKVIKPNVILALGSQVTRWFLGEDYDIEAIHGVPHQWNGKTLLPTHHPAAGFFSTSVAAQTYWDMQQFRRVVEVDNSVLQRGYPTNLAWFVSISFPTFEQVKRVAVDTEGWESNPDSLSYCYEPNYAGVVPKAVCKGGRIEAEEVVFHNALHDLGVLRALGVKLKYERLHDTMVLAYLIGVEPQGLKPLSWRWLREAMTEFPDLVRPYYEMAMLDYLEWVSGNVWDKPEARVVQPHPAVPPKVYTPQGLNQRVAKLLKEYHTSVVRVDLKKRWEAIAPDIRQVAESLRPAPAFDIELVPDKRKYRYSAKDPESTLRVFPYLMKTATKLGLESVYKVDMGFLPFVDLMQQSGMQLDLEKVHELRSLCRGIMRTSLRRLSDMGLRCNPMSGDQVAKIVTSLYSGHLKSTKTKSRISTDDETLEGLANTLSDSVESHRTLRKFIGHVMTYREALKVDGVAETLPGFMWPDGSIRARFRITRTGTGRLSTADPNLLALPTHAELGKALKRCFRARPGYVYVGADYSQIELRMMADESEDPTMLRAFRHQEDLHIKTAGSLFQIAEESVTKTQRQVGKLGNFSFMFGLSPKAARAKGLQEGLDYPETWWAATINAWFRKYSAVEARLKRAAQEARQHGFVRDWLGRIRWLPLVHSRDEFVRAEAERQAGNFPIQGGAAEVMKVGGCRIYHEIVDKRDEIAPLLAIHDELMFEVEEDRADYWRGRLSELMTVQPFEGHKFRVPIEVDVKTATDWTGLKEG